MSSSGVDPSVLLRFKLESLFYIAITALAGGLLPLKLRVRDRLLSFGNVLSGGIFLAAGFTHMLPEAVEGFKQLELLENLPLPYILCMFGILLTFFIEKVAFATQHQHHHALFSSHGEGVDLEELQQRHSTQPEISRGIVKKEGESNVNMYMLIVLLSVHSVIEGIALGIEDTIEDTTTILIAIVGHKFFSAFAFGVNLAKNNVPSDKLVRFVLLFTCMTPFGIALGLTVIQNPGGPLSQIMNAISAGTFVYIALVEVILEEFENPKDKYWKFALLMIGTLIMTVLSTRGHSHEGHSHSISTS